MRQRRRWAMTMGLVLVLACDATDDGGVGGPASDAGASATSGDDGVDGCGLDPGERGARTITVSAAGLDRTALLVIPPDYDPDVRWPLVLAFHGLGSDAEGLRHTAGEAPFEDAAIIAYPQGLPLDEMGGDAGWDLASDGRDVALFDALLAEIQGTLCVDVDRIYATGNSYGGWMANVLGCARAEVLSAIAPVSGGGPLPGCSGSVAAWIAHGEDDPIAPTSFGEASRDHWVAANGCVPTPTSTAPAPCVAYPGCNPGRDVVWCLHTEGVAGQPTRHGWPSFASAAIRTFFAAH